MDAWWAVGWATFGGTISALLLKLLEWLMSRGSEKRLQRADLLVEIEKLWARLDTKDLEVAKLRQEVAASEERYRQRIEALEAELAKCRYEHAELQREYTELQARLPTVAWEDDGIA